jgi:hypothetical protein
LTDEDSPVCELANATLRPPLEWTDDTRHRSARIDKDFGEFMTAVALYFGPAVATYSIWNEPNHPAFLMPQWTASGTPASPRIYRGLYQAAYAGLQAAGLRHPEVLFGETAPIGYEAVSKTEGAVSKHPVAHLLFLRSALCLNDDYQKSASCSEILMSGYAHHPYFKSPAGPYYAPAERDDVTIGSIGRLSAALDKAAAAHAIPAHVPIDLTEFGVESKPNRYEDLPVSQQAEYDAIAERMAWANPRVAAFSQYLLEGRGRRVPASTAEQWDFKPASSTSAACRSLGGVPKPLYFGFPVPMTVTKTRRGVDLWGLVRPSRGATRATILVRPNGASGYKVLRTAATNSEGYWSFAAQFRRHLEGAVDQPRRCTLRRPTDPGR